jgi:carbamoyltransferase
VNILGVTGATYWNANLEGSGKWVHGAGLTLIIDGKLVFSISNERFTRIKYDGNFSKSIAIDVLSKFNLTPKDIDILVTTDYGHESPNLNFPNPDNYISFEEFFKGIFINAEIFVVDHHLSHSMGTLLTSPFKDEDVNVYSFDAAGSTRILYNIWAENWSSLNIANYKNKQFISLYNEFAIPELAPLFGGGVGGFYVNYSGFSLVQKSKIKWEGVRANPWLAESLPGKVMGLSAYGSVLDIPSPMKLYASKTNGYIIPNIVPSDEYTESHLFQIAPYLARFDPVIQNQPCKFSGEDIAAWVQYNFEKIMIEYFLKLPKQVKKKKLCLGGGCALNILLNSKLIEEGIFEDIHIPPAPNDDGLHQGAALLKAWELEKELTLPTNLGCIGLEYTDTDIINAINKHNLKYFPNDFDIKTFNFEEVLNYTAISLQHNKIIGWYQGKSEFGPRALGNRSILANPCYDNKDHLNTKVKKREEWRPYAAVVLEEHIDEWFDLPKKDSYYMLFSAKVKSNKLGLIPSVTHVDNSCRIQVVNREQNEKLYLLLKKFYELTNIPILLNTSFNTILKEPIVETPYDAINSFMNSKMDMVILHNIIIERNNISNDINIEYT